MEISTSVSVIIRMILDFGLGFLCGGGGADQLFWSANNYAEI